MKKKEVFSYSSGLTIVCGDVSYLFNGVNDINDLYKILSSNKNLNYKCIRFSNKTRNMGTQNTGDIFMMNLEVLNEILDISLLNKIFAD